MRGEGTAKREKGKDRENVEEKRREEIKWRRERMER